MKVRLVHQSNNKKIRFSHFGYEDIPTDAKWGPGCRDVWIIHYVLSGKGYYNGIPLSSGEGFVIRPNDLAEYHYDEANPWTYFWIVLEEIQPDEIWHNHISLKEPYTFSYNFPKKLSQIIPIIFSDITELLENEALALFFYLMSLHENRPVVKSNHYVSNAKNYMLLHINKPITVVDVAEAQGVSDRYLYNLFIKHEGISPKQYLNELRMNHARLLLQSNRYSITEIAASAGFTDVMTFSRFFSKSEGISPSQYRKNSLST